jgi:hypothetical protein
MGDIQRLFTHGEAPLGLTTMIWWLAARAIFYQNDQQEARGPTGVPELFEN